MCFHLGCTPPWPRLSSIQWRKRYLLTETLLPLRTRCGRGHALQLTQLELTMVEERGGDDGMVEEGVIVMELGAVDRGVVEDGGLLV